MSTAEVGRPVGADREAKVIRGMVVAQEGDFKTPGRGSFDIRGLQRIVDLGNKTRGGLKSRFTHPDMSGDGLGSFLGRCSDFGLSRTLAEGDDGPAPVRAVRCDLQLSASAFGSPKGNLGQYILDLVAEDPDALSSSLALQTDKEDRFDPNGRPLVDDDGDELPPLWLPTRLHACDIVDTGDAVDGLLGAGVDVDNLPLAALWKADALLDTVFAGQPFAVVEARLRAWLDRYLERLRGASPRAGRLSGGVPSVLRRRLRLREQEARG